MKRPLISIVGLAALGLLCACGVKGDLARPDPLWNRDEVLRRECARQAARGIPEDARCAALETGASPEAPAPQ